MTAKSLSDLATSLGEVTSLLCGDNSCNYDEHGISRPQSTDQQVWDEHDDLGTMGTSFPCLSPTYVSSYFTFLNSEDDSNPMSDCSDDGSAGESGSMSPVNQSEFRYISSPAEETMDDVTPLHRRVSRRKKQHGQQMWQFILETLNNDNYNPELIRWVDRETGVFKFIQSRRVAELWNRKRGGAKSFEHFSRSMRHYYKKGIMSRIPNKRLVYKFESNATDWVRLVVGNLGED